MIRIKREYLDECVKAFMMCALFAKNTYGLRIICPITQQQAEAAVLGALSTIEPHGGPATAEDTKPIHQEQTG